MPKSTPTLDWAIVRLGDDHNWWVEELSDTVHWDVDGLSIIDPRQIDHIVELCEPLREYSFDLDSIDSTFIPFRIDRDLGNGRVRLVRVRDSFLESEEKLFALPDMVDEENGPYADFLDHITRARVKMLNDLFDFEHKLTVDEVEDQLREEQSNRFMEGKAVHLFDEIVSILDYVPEGWETDEDTPAKAEVEDEEEFPEIEDEEEEEKLKGDASLKWDEDEEKEDEDEKAEDKDAEKADDEDDESPEGTRRSRHTHDDESGPAADKQPERPPRPRGARR